MPFLVQKTYWDKDPSNKYVVNKIVRDIDDVNSIRDWARNVYKEEAKKIFDDFCSGCHDNIKELCDINQLEEIIEEISEEEASEELKYKLIIESIIQWFFCAVQAKELLDWDPDNGIITTFYTI